MKHASQHLVRSDRFNRHRETGITTADMTDITTYPPEDAGRGLRRRLHGELSRSSASISAAISDLVSKRKLDAGAIAALEDALIRADLGVDAAVRIAAFVGEGR